MKTSNKILRIVFWQIRILVLFLALVFIEVFLEKFDMIHFFGSVKILTILWIICAVVVGVLLWFDKIKSFYKL